MRSQSLLIYLGIRNFLFSRLLKKSFPALGCHSCGSSPAFGGMDSRFGGSDGELEFFRILLDFFKLFHTPQSTF